MGVVRYFPRISRLSSRCRDGEEDEEPPHFVSHFNDGLHLEGVELENSRQHFCNNETDSIKGGARSHLTVVVIISIHPPPLRHPVDIDPDDRQGGIGHEHSDCDCGVICICMDPRFLVVLRVTRTSSPK